MKVEPAMHKEKKVVSSMLKRDSAIICEQGIDNLERSKTQLDTHEIKAEKSRPPLDPTETAAAAAATLIGRVLSLA